LDPEGLKKSKLNISYITAPLLLEVKTPLRMGTSNLYISGGVIGGLNIGSHTKYKYKNDKEKARSNFNLNQFKYDLTGRIGIGDFCVFVNYGMTPLFKNNQGPELFPVTFGFSFPNI
ncbi:MAG: outer membrane beta-barrel protein, partial [Prolixibacteraceae bacterium]|nr:outer membrane beta-barrel protein [Prolixibacteraceae bacterium]